MLCKVLLYEHNYPCPLLIKKSRSVFSLQLHGLCFYHNNQFLVQHTNVDFKSHAHQIENYIKPFKLHSYTIIIKGAGVLFFLCM